VVNRVLICILDRSIGINIFHVRENTLVVTQKFLPGLKIQTAIWMNTGEPVLAGGWEQRLRAARQLVNIARFLPVSQHLNRTGSIPGMRAAAGSGIRAARGVSARFGVWVVGHVGRAHRGR